MVCTVRLSALAAGLDLGRHEHIAVVGGGGKTTIVHELGSQLRGTVVLTCTTKMGHDQHRGRAVLLDPVDAELVEAAGNAPVMVWQRIEGQKAVGVAPEMCDRWFSLVDHVVIEADGSRRRPFKAPARHEPVVPSTATLVLSVIGADALGRVIADQCHRPLRVAALAGCTPYERLSPVGAARVLLHERGARKSVPDGARFAVAVTKVGEANAGFVADLVDAVRTGDPETDIVAVAATPDSTDSNGVA